MVKQLYCPDCGERLATIRGIIMCLAPGCEFGVPETFGDEYVRMLYAPIHQERHYPLPDDYILYNPPTPYARD